MGVTKGRSWRTQPRAGAVSFVTGNGASLPRPVLDVLRDAPQRLPNYGGSAGVHLTDLI
jgi:hypothetical protein